MEFKKLKIIILSTDTLHHRYFINTLKKSKIKIHKYVFETTSVKPKFKEKNFFKKEENIFEKKNFFKKISKSMDEKKVIKLKNINSNKSLKTLNNLKMDLGIVFGCRKINQNIIDQFKYGLINIHRGVIQKYRGLDSDLWAILKKDFKNIGVCLHLIDKNLDTGAIIQQKKIKIKKNMKIFHMKYLTTLLATQMTIDLLKKSSKNFKFLKKQKKLGSYYSFMPYNEKNNAKIIFDQYVKKLK